MASAGAIKRTLAGVCLSWGRLAHRWLGIASCLLCVMWFLSGLVMMYVPFPTYSEADRLSTAAPLDAAQIKISPREALANAQFPAPPNAFVLEMWGREPTYRLLGAGRAVAISARDGQRIESVPVEIAKQRLMEAGFTARLIAETERDQWTATSSHNPFRPFYVFALDDDARTELYVSARTGEVVQRTTGHQRFWNYLGAIPHWIYLTSIRSDAGVWRKVILWTSGTVVLLALSGTALGIYRTAARWGIGRRGLSPFKGWLRWHHLAGLVGGLPLITWIVTGWLSVNPFGLFASMPPLFQNIPNYYGSERIPFEISAPVVGDIATTTNARQLSFSWLDGKPLLVANNGAKKVTVDGRNGAIAPLTDEMLSEAAQHLLPDNRIARLQRLTVADNYWYSHRFPRPLPVMRMDFDDDIGSWIYVDLYSGRILSILNNEQRSYRWIFNLFHSLDAPFLLRNRPLWDVIMILLLLAGLAASCTGTVVAWRALKRARQVE